MEIIADAVIPYERPLVFATYRDNLPDLVRYLPNIREIKVRTRADRGIDVDLVNDWKGGGDIPAVARSVLSESMLTWTDHATWFGADFRVEWRTDVHAFPGAVKSAGTNRFVEIPEGTRLAIRGELTCDAAKVPGVPKLLAKTVGATVEKVMVAQIAKNALEIARGVAKMIEARKTP
jgi:hypothetical protein